MASSGTYDLNVPNGQHMSVATSSLIKHLRKGEELPALYWAQQLEKQYHGYLWRRLLIFASEDVSLANPMAVVQVRALADNYAEVKKNSKNPVVDRSILTMAVMVLARSEKTRECDDLLNVIDHLQNAGYAPEPPDDAADLHSQEGKRRWPRRYRLRHWLEAASHEEHRVGARDWHLWLLKWGAQRGVYAVDWVKDLAHDWSEMGLLKYGEDGLPAAQWDWENVEPEFPGLEPARPEIGPDMFMANPWDWHCKACKTPLPVCQDGHPCCEHCTHAVRDEVDLDG